MDSLQSPGLTQRTQLQLLEDIIHYASTIQVSLRVRRKDINVYFEVFVNHIRAGELVLPTDEYADFAYVFRKIGWDIFDEALRIENTDLKIQQGVRHYTKLHEPRNHR